MTGGAGRSPVLGRGENAGREGLGRGARVRLAPKPDVPGEAASGRRAVLIELVLDAPGAPSFFLFFRFEISLPVHEGKVAAQHVVQRCRRTGHSAERPAAP